MDILRQGYPEPLSAQPGLITMATHMHNPDPVAFSQLYTRISHIQSNNFSLEICKKNLFSITEDSCVK